MKEHLLLVANSITCTGSLVGFNTGGYKALFRSFKVQVPFTAATLFVSISLAYRTLCLSSTPNFAIFTTLGH